MLINVKYKMLLPLATCMMQHCEFYLNSTVQHNNYAIPYHRHVTTIEIQNGKHVGNVFMIHNSKSNTKYRNALTQFTLKTYLTHCHLHTPGTEAAN